MRAGGSQPFGAVSHRSHAVVRRIREERLELARQHAGALLSRPALLQTSYRDIAEASGVALDLVGSVFQDLAARGWLVNASAAPRRRLTAPDRLLEEWVANYPSILRPRLQSRRFEALEPGWWRTAPPASFEHAYWIGEVAGKKLTGYLRAETQTLYVVPEYKAGFLKRLGRRIGCAQSPMGRSRFSMRSGHRPPRTNDSAEAGMAPTLLVLWQSPITWPLGSRPCRVSPCSS